MKIHNMFINKSDMKFNIEEMKPQIELTLIGDNNLYLNFITSTNPDNLVKLYNVFDVFSVNQLKGKYCRAYVNEQTNKIDYIKNIIYDFDLQINNEENY